jgi:hypothetical protein
MVAQGGKAAQRLDKNKKVCKINNPKHNQCPFMGFNRINRIVKESKEYIDNNETLKKLPKSVRRAILLTLVACSAPGWGVAVVGGVSYCLGKEKATKDIALRSMADIPEMFRGTLSPILPALERGEHRTTLLVSGVEYPVRIRVSTDEVSKTIHYTIFQPGLEEIVLHEGELLIEK